MDDLKTLLKGSTSIHALSNDASSFKRIEGIELIKVIIAKGIHETN